MQNRCTDVLAYRYCPPDVCFVKESDLLGTLHLSSQTEQQLVGDRVHQVEEGGVLVQDVVERGAFQTQILPEQTTGEKTVQRSQLKVSSSETLDLRIKCVSGGKTRPCCVEGDATGDGEIKDVFCFKYSLKETGASSSTVGERSLQGGAGNTMFVAYIITAPRPSMPQHRRLAPTRPISSDGKTVEISLGPVSIQNTHTFKGTVHPKL